MNITPSLINYRTFVQVVLSFSSLLLFGCHQSGQEHSASAARDSTASVNLSASTSNSLAAARQNTTIKAFSRDSVTAIGTHDTVKMAANITNWQVFWRQLKTAAKKKDTTAIIRMTYFPFYNNGSPDNKEDWETTFPGDIFRLDDEQDEPAFIGQKGFGGEDYHTKVFSSIECDSVFVVGIDHGLIYFAKIDGGFKLVGKLNPG